ncbi:MAG TPA: tetratricopeptide repeat protein, partial [Bordetella sp.]
MPVSRQALVLGLLAVAASQPVWAQSDVSKTLLEQGRYWQAQGRSELAEQSWAKLLTTDPNQPEALYGMGAIAVGKQQLTQAQTYLAKLRAAAPSSRYVPLLEQDLRLAVEPGKSALVKARQMAQDAGTQQDKAAMSAAIAQYDLALGGKTPQGAVAREYYTNLGYAQDGLDRAIQGLQRLNAEDPNNPAILMPLAQHMTSDDARRVDGLHLLEKLSTRPDTGGAATEYWRGVLGWMGPPRPQDKPLFEAYLKLHPDDDEIRRQMLQPPSAGAGGSVHQDPRLVRGAAAIKSGDLDTAEQAFSDVLREKPDSADALGGLGVVRMQQDKLAQAESLLSRAVSRPGGGGWVRALNTARYWTLVNQANASQSAGDTDLAQRQLDQAMKLDAHASAARNALAKMYAEQGDLAKAENTYRAVLASDPGNRDAVSGLVGVMAQTGRADQAMAWINSMTPDQQTSVGGLGRLRAAAASGQAKAAEQRGDMDAARQALEDARRNDPENPWIRLDLASYYLDNDQQSEARSLADSLASSPETPDTLYARALLASQMGEWSKAQETVARIPAADRTVSMQTLARQIDFLAQADHASKLAKDGQQQEARELLTQLEPEAGQNPAMLG